MASSKIYLIIILFSGNFLQVDAQNLLEYKTQLITISSPEPTYLSVDKGRFVYPQQTGYMGTNNPSAYELNNSDIPSRSNYSRGTTISFVQAIQMITNVLNKEGYSLKLTVVRKFNNLEMGEIILIFEKSTSYREEALYKLYGEMNTKIDTISKNYIEKAKTEINQNVLNYLKEIPSEVLAQSFKEELQTFISNIIDKKFYDLKEEIKLEFKKP